MATTLSLHQQDTMVSTLSVLLLTLNKALPGGRPRIARVSLMVRVKFSLNKFSSSLVLKTSRTIILFPLSRWIQHQVQVQVWGRSLKDHHCHTHSRSPTDATHNIVCTNMTRGKARTPDSASHLVVWLDHYCLDPHLLQKRWFVHHLPLNSLDSWVWMVFKSYSLKSNSKWINVLRLLYMFPMVGLHMFYSMLITLMLENKNP